MEDLKKVCIFIDRNGYLKRHSPFVCLTEDAAHLLKPKSLVGVQFSYFVCPVSYDSSDHQVQLLKVKDY